jgi:hypothetical protein
VVGGFVLVISPDETVQRWDGFCTLFFNCALLCFNCACFRSAASRRRGMGVCLLAGQSFGQSFGQSVNWVVGLVERWVSFK